MIETLLPDAGAAAESGGRPRLLELAFPPAKGPGPHGRPGWITVVQTQGACPAGALAQPEAASTAVQGM